MNDPVFDYARLRGKIKEVFGTQDAFADAIGLGSVSVSRKCSDRLMFWVFHAARFLNIFLPKKFRKTNAQSIDRR